MLKKTIKFSNLDGEEVSEDFYFHISKAELIEMEMSHSGGLSEWLRNVVADEDGKSIISEFKKIILGAYGERSPDGRRFIKNQELRDEFEQTDAYSVLFVELVTNTDAAIEFVNGVMPQGLVEEAAKIAAAANGGESGTKNVEDQQVDEPRITIRMTKAEVAQMPHEEFEKLGPRIASGEVIVED